MEQRLIDANALWELMRTYDDYQGAKEAHDLELIHRDSILFAIENAPTVDAVPVVHGEWKMGIDANGDPVTYCSNCKMPNYVQTNYCPDCGAKMNMKKGKQE